MENKVCFQIHQHSQRIKILAPQPLDFHFHYHSEFRCLLINSLSVVMIEASVSDILIYFQETLETS